jgi:ATP-dependent DNA helicase RecG
MRLRGYGDIIGFKQSGIKLFKIADPVHHENLFKLAEKKIKELNDEQLNSPKYDFLLQLFDKVDLTNKEGTSS